VVERLAGRLAPSDGPPTRFTAKTATVKRATEEKRQRKKRQPENWATAKKSATKNKRVGKQGNKINV